MAATAVLAFVLLRPDYQVLFADLTVQDAAAMTAELDRLKVPYAISDGSAGEGTTILVDRNDVYRTRMKVMGKDLPLHGAVGFELFNGSDFGMTEFAQKINYQRALQGELTRTILSLSEVRDARVLLALPEQGLFKQPTSKAKASVTLSLKRGQALRPEQVVGIQRLVSAAVPGVSAQDVTLVDHTGVALTRAAADGDSGEASSGRLELKKETEAYLSRKATQVLERALGAGQALATVDVMLDMVRVQSTTENVTAAPTRPGHVTTGVVVRERESLRESAAPLATRTAATGTGSVQGGSSQREVEYAVGRRVEQVMSQPGSIQRIQVVAVVKKALDPAREQQLPKLVAATVGASLERGDTVVVQSMDEFAGPTSARAAIGGLWKRTRSESRRRRRATPRRGATGCRGQRSSASASSLRSSSHSLACVPLGCRWRRAAPGGRVAPRRPLSENQRRAALTRVQAWLRSEDRPQPHGERP